MFHVELRQFPHVARAFNLTREQLEAQILAPWVAGSQLELQDRQWSADKAKLTIVEGSALRPDEIGLGRGWGNATKRGEDVTARLLAETERAAAPPPGDELREAIVEVCARVPVALGEIVALVGAQEPQRRPSELLARAEQAVWELLHHGRIALLEHGEPVAPDCWQKLLLSWSSWTGERDLEIAGR
jgi:hypothetical protein